MQEERALSGENTYTWEIENPVLWSAEDPQLYDLELEVCNGNGELQELIPERVGFRRFEMKDGIMTLNGKRIVFKGVNRHEFSSVTGRHVSRRGAAKRYRHYETEQHQCHPYLPLSGCFSDLPSLR